MTRGCCAILVINVFSTDYSLFFFFGFRARAQLWHVLHLSSPFSISTRPRHGRVPGGGVWWELFLSVRANLLPPGASSESSSEVLTQSSSVVWYQTALWNERWLEGKSRRGLQSKFAISSLCCLFDRPEQTSGRFELSFVDLSTLVAPAMLPFISLE